MIEYIMLALLVVVLVLVLVLVIILGRLANMIMGFLGGAEQGGEGLPNIDFEKVLAKLMMDGGTQLLQEAKAEKGGLLGQVRNLFNPKDKKELTDKLDNLAGVEPGKLLIDKTAPAPNMMDLLSGNIPAPGPGAPGPGEK